MPSEACCAGRWATVAFFFFDANFAPAPVSVASSFYVASILCSMTISHFIFSPTSSCRTLLRPLHSAVGVEMIHPPSVARLNPRKPLLSRPQAVFFFYVSAPRSCLPSRNFSISTLQSQYRHIRRYPVLSTITTISLHSTCLHLCTSLCIFLAFKEEVTPGSSVTVKHEADSLKRALTSLN